MAIIIVAVKHMPQYVCYMRKKENVIDVDCLQCNIILAENHTEGTL